MAMGSSRSWEDDDRRPQTPYHVFTDLAHKLSLASDPARTEKLKIWLEKAPSLEGLGASGGNILSAVIVNDRQLLPFVLAHPGCPLNDLNRWGQSAVFYAISPWTHTALPAVLNAGPRLDIQDEDGNTVFHKAAKDCLTALRQLMPHATPALLALENHGKRTALAQAITWTDKDSPEAVRLLLEAGASPAHACLGGILPLRLAAQSSRALEKLKVLVAAGADVLAAWPDGLQDDLVGYPEVARFIEQVILERHLNETIPASSVVTPGRSPRL
jgi:hypothetical protein